MVITNNGRPAALLLDLGKEDFEETLDAIKRAKAAKRGFLKVKSSLFLITGLWMNTWNHYPSL
jgi:hypothetical protein